MDQLSRRELLLSSLLLPGAAAVLAACGDEEGSPTQDSQPAAKLPPTPACGEEAGVTPEQTEGPFFTPDSPRRTSLRERGVAGIPLLLTGTVLATDCQPIPGALLDFWQADGEGVYDLEGFRLRGHQFADRAGRFRLGTVVPGLYPGRTRHIHVKAQPRGGDVLTTQLYFPGEASNDADPIFDPALLVAEQGGGSGRRVTFDFVLEA